MVLNDQDRKVGPDESALSMMKWTNAQWPFDEKGQTDNGEARGDWSFAPKNNEFMGLFYVGNCHSCQIAELTQSPRAVGRRPADGVARVGNKG